MIVFLDVLIDELPQGLEFGLNLSVGSRVEEEMVQRGRIVADGRGRLLGSCEWPRIDAMDSRSVTLFFTLSAEEEPSGHKTDQDAANSTSHGCTCECSCGVTRRAIVAGRSRDTR